MGIIASQSSGDFTVVPEGVHQAVCYGVVDIGHQYSEKWDKMSHKIIVLWEIPSERITINGKDLPMVVSKKYTLSLGKKANLRKDLESWRGRSFTDEELAGFDITNLVTVNCMIQIIHSKSNEKTYANISSILPLYKGLQKVAPEGKIMVYSIDDGDPPEYIHKWIADLIRQSTEFSPPKKEEPIHPIGENKEPGNSEIPF